MSFILRKPVSAWYNKSNWCLLFGKAYQYDKFCEMSSDGFWGFLNLYVRKRNLIIVCIFVQGFRCELTILDWFHCKCGICLQAIPVWRQSYCSYTETLHIGDWYMQNQNYLPGTMVVNRIFILMWCYRESGQFLSGIDFYLLKQENYMLLQKSIQTCIKIQQHSLIQQNCYIDLAFTEWLSFFFKFTL